MNQNIEALKRFHDLSDQEQVKRVGGQIEALLRTEEMTEATAAMVVGSILGWFINTLPDHPRLQFERAIEAHFEVAASARQDPTSR